MDLNIQVILSFLASQLHTYIYICSPRGEILARLCKYVSIPDLLENRSDIQSFLLEVTTPSHPVICSLNQNIFFCTVAVQETIYFIGPVSIISNMPVLHNMDCNLSDRTLHLSLKHFTLANLLEHVLLLFNLYQKEPLDTAEYIRRYCSKYELEQNVLHNILHNAHILEFNNMEYNQTHNSYEQEAREMLSIEQGDLDEFKKNRVEPHFGELGVLAKSTLRNAKNLAIVVITNASRAAIRGGLHPEIAFSLSDSFIQHIEEQNDSTQIALLVENAEISLTKMVHEFRTGTSRNSAINPVVKECKKYILNHMHEKITLQDMAKQLSMNPSYLSTLFKKYEGVSLYQYIINEKIAVVKRLLLYSDYTYNEIASYLGFSSQSHLGQQFKSNTNLTLKQYRNSRNVKDSS